MTKDIHEVVETLLRERRVWLLTSMRQSVYALGSPDNIYDARIMAAITDVLPTKRAFSGATLNPERAVAIKGMDFNVVFWRYKNRHGERDEGLCFLTRTPRDMMLIAIKVGLTGGYDPSEREKTQ